MSFVDTEAPADFVTEMTAARIEQGPNLVPERIGQIDAFLVR